MKRIAIIGGDRREKVAIKQLANRGYELSVFSQEEFYKHNHIYYDTDINKIIINQDVIIAPMSGTDENGVIKKSFVDEKLTLNKNIFKKFSEGTIFLIGIARPEVKKALIDQKIKFTEMALEDDIAILNAIPTAEGAIQTLITENPDTIFGSKIMILGLGKVGFALAWRLKALGAEVYAATRSKIAIAHGRDIGIKIIEYQEIHPFLKNIKIFFNTVPALIIDDSYLKYMNSDSYIYDLASSPGGTDFYKAHKKGIKAKLLPGLPGKVAPDFSGKIIAENIEVLIARARFKGVK